MKMPSGSGDPFSWLPADLIQNALRIGSAFGFTVVATSADRSGVVVDLGAGRVVYLILADDNLQALR